MKKLIFIMACASLSVDAQEKETAVSRSTVEEKPTRLHRKDLTDNNKSIFEKAKNSLKGVFCQKKKYRGLDDEEEVTEEAVKKEVTSSDLCVKPLVRSRAPSMLNNVVVPTFGLLALAHGTNCVDTGTFLSAAVSTIKGLGSIWNENKEPIKDFFGSVKNMTSFGSTPAPRNPEQISEWEVLRDPFSLAFYGLLGVFAPKKFTTFGHALAIGIRYFGNTICLTAHSENSIVNAAIKGTTCVNLGGAVRFIHVANPLFLGAMVIPEKIKNAIQNGTKKLFGISTETDVDRTVKGVERLFAEDGSAHKALELSMRKVFGEEQTKILQTFNAQRAHNPMENAEGLEEGLRSRQNEA